MVGATGFEPVTTRTPSVCATRLRYAPTFIEVGVTLTSDIRQSNLAGRFTRFPLEASLSSGTESRRSLYNTQFKATKGTKATKN
jgi:hypothetical protein